MEKKTKKILIGAGLVTAIGAAAWYFLIRSSALEVSSDGTAPSGSLKDKDGNSFALSDDKDVHGNNFILVNGTHNGEAFNLVKGSDGLIYATNKQGRIFKYSGTTWMQTAGTPLSGLRGFNRLMTY